MKLALSAKITCHPKRVLENRWVHDTAHVLLRSILKERLGEPARAKNRKN